MDRTGRGGLEFIAEGGSSPGAGHSEESTHRESIPLSHPAGSPWAGWAAAPGRSTELGTLRPFIPALFDEGFGFKQPQAQHPPPRALGTGREGVHRAAPAMFQLQVDGEGHSGVTQEQ